MDGHFMTEYVMTFTPEQRVDRVVEDLEKEYQDIRRENGQFCTTLTQFQMGKLQGIAFAIESFKREFHPNLEKDPQQLSFFED